MVAHLPPDAFEPEMALLRDNVLSEARGWLGTPYQHQASLKGVGCDCLGLLRGVWRAFYGDEPKTAPDYSSDWAETGGQENLLTAGRRWLVERAKEVAEPGDVLVFRWRDGSPAKHVGILSAPITAAPHIIHAYERVGVIESPLVPAWQRRIATVFSFPEID
ncbi:MAG: peptidase P60 [Roseibium sp.]